MVGLKSLRYLKQFLLYLSLSENYIFLRNDAKSDHLYRRKRLSICLIPVWILSLALSIMIAILFVYCHQHEGYIQIPGPIHNLYVHDKYLYAKYIVRLDSCLRWPDNEYKNSYMKLAEIGFVMVNQAAIKHLTFKFPYVCFEKSLLHQC